MTDDPREILKAAGVECAPLDSWENLANARFMTRVQWEEAAAELGFGDAAIIALARLAAEVSPLDWVVTRTSRDGAQAVAAHFASYDDADRYCKTMNRSRRGRDDRFTFRGRLDHDV